jgi:glycosyltransferase involved in cell wall biosynthesis
VAGASRALFAAESGRPGLPKRPGSAAVLPCGADLERFRPAPKAEARNRLGLDPAGRYLLFPAAPDRPAKRHDRAAEVARLAEAELLTAGAIPSERMPDWVNAANAVLVTSDNEGFGLAAVEALACDIPVLSTPVGISPALARDIDGCLVEPFEAQRWTELARRHLADGDPRVAGRERAAWFSADPMAERVVVAYREVLGGASKA